MRAILCMILLFGSFAVVGTMNAIDINNCIACGRSEAVCYATFNG